MEGLREWLIQHEAAAAVTELVVADVHIDYRSEAAVLPLPAPQLQQLQKLALSRCRLSFDHTENRRLTVSSLTSLTSLVLEGVELASGVRGLSALTGLQELQLSNFPRGAGVFRQEMMYCLCSLTQLTRLVLERSTLLDRRTMNGGVALFDCLQQLQELTVHGMIGGRRTLLRLPQSLTKLDLTWGNKGLSSSLCPGLAALTNLQHLQLHAACHSGPVLPDFCSNMQQLRVLHLSGLFSRDALPILAQVLPALSCLESLVIANSTYDFIPMPAADARYAALLPQSLHLTRLELSLHRLNQYMREETAIMRAGYGQHLFAAGRQLP